MLPIELSDLVRNIEVQIIRNKTVLRIPGAGIEPMRTITVPGF